MKKYLTSDSFGFLLLIIINTATICLGVNTISKQKETAKQLNSLQILLQEEYYLNDKIKTINSTKYIPSIHCGDTLTFNFNHAYLNTKYDTWRIRIIPKTNN